MIESFLSHRPAGSQADDAGLATLTQRERETLEPIARGLTNAEIAETFVVSETTVKTHVSRVLMKLGVATASTRSSTPTSTDPTPGDSTTPGPEAVCPTVQRAAVELRTFV